MRVIILLSVVRVSLELSGYPERNVSIAKAFMKLPAKLFALREEHTGFCHSTIAVSLLQSCELKIQTKNHLLLLNSFYQNSQFVKQMELLSRLRGEGTSRETVVIGNYFMQIQNTGRAMGCLF